MIATHDTKPWPTAHDILERWSPDASASAFHYLTLRNHIDKAAPSSFDYLAVIPPFLGVTIEDITSTHDASHLGRLRRATALVVFKYRGCVNWPVQEGALGRSYSYLYGVVKEARTKPPRSRDDLHILLNLDDFVHQRLAAHLHDLTQIGEPKPVLTILRQGARVCAHHHHYGFTTPLCKSVADAIQMAHIIRRDLDDRDPERPS